MLFEQGDGVTVYTKATPESPVNCVKAWIKLPQSVEKARDYCWGMGEKDFKKFDSASAKCVEVEESENTRIRETVTNLPWPIWSRYGFTFSLQF